MNNYSFFRKNYNDMALKSVSVVIEWENVLLSEMERCRQMLHQLRRQILELNSQSPARVTFEIIVVFNRETVPATVVTGEMKQVFQANDPDIVWKLNPAEGLNYYDLKNFGAQAATGDVILFLDSDVIPETDWLKALLGAFEQPGVEMACGHTFLDLSDFLGRAMAPFWIFPLRAIRPELKETASFLANNVAFRRTTAARFPFPKMPEGSTRGSCMQLSHNLRNAGIKLYRQMGAQVSHPAPNGWRHFLVRGVAAGRDDLMSRRSRRGQPWLVWESLRELRRCFTNILRGWFRILTLRKRANLSLIETPPAMGLAMVYFQCRLFGAWGTQLFPGYMEDHFRI